MGPRDSFLPTGRDDVCMLLSYDGLGPRCRRPLWRRTNLSPLTQSPPLPHSVVGSLYSSRGAQRLMLYPPPPTHLCARAPARAPQDVKQREADRRRTVVTPAPHYVTGAQKAREQFLRNPIAGEYPQVWQAGAV